MHKSLQLTKAVAGLQHNIQYFGQFVKHFLCDTKLFKSAGRSLLFAKMLCSVALAGFEDLDYGARGVGLAGAVSAAALGAESFGYNPAGLLVDPAGMQAVVSYAHPFEFNELTLGQVAMVYGRNNRAVGGGLLHFGNALYGEHQFCAGAAVRLPRLLTVGVAGRYGNLSIRNYGQSSALMVDLGLRAELSRLVSWGAAVKNINGAVIGREREPLPQIFSVGLAVRPRDELQLLFDFNKDIRFRLDLRCGLVYQPLKTLSLRAGVADQPRRFALGLSVHVRRLRFDYAYLRHLELGDTHMAAIGVE